MKISLIDLSNKLLQEFAEAENLEIKNKPKTKRDLKVLDPSQQTPIFRNYANQRQYDIVRIQLDRLNSEISQFVLKQTHQNHGMQPEIQELEHARQSLIYRIAQWNDFINCEENQQFLQPNQWNSIENLELEWANIFLAQKLIFRQVFQLKEDMLPNIARFAGSIEVLMKVFENRLRKFLLVGRRDKKLGETLRSSVEIPETIFYKNRY